MANVIHRTTGEYRTSVNTPDYPASVWIINPIIPAGYALDDCVVDGNALRPMTAAELATRDAARAEAARIAALAAVCRQARDMRRLMRDALADGDCVLNASQTTQVTDAKAAIRNLLLGVDNGTITDPVAAAALLPVLTGPLRKKLELFA